MKALTNSCSKAIVERLGSPSHRVGVVHVPDRVEFCFSLRSRNDKRGCNFWFLKMVPNKGICPVHAVPSKTEVDLESADPDLETVERQAQQSEQTNESKFVHVTFQLQKNCKFGEQFLIVGDDPMLGSWDPAEALPLTWSNGHIWTVDLDMRAGKSVQFKFILKGKAGNIIWQPGSDRIINTSETMNRITVSGDWENAELREIIEEDQLAQSNEEPQVNSEMSTFAENLDHPEEELVSNLSELLGIEASQTYAEEKPAESDPQQTTTDNIPSLEEKPMAIVAENIGSLEDFSRSTSYEKNIRNIQLSEESADSARNDDINIIHDGGHNDNATRLMNQERTVVEGNLFDLEEPGPVLVPGLTPPVVPTEEECPGEVQERTTKEASSEAFESKDGEVQERTTMETSSMETSSEAFESMDGEFQERSAMETSSEAFESKDQNIPEFNKEQESDDGTPQEINATINDEPQHRDNGHEEQFHIVPGMEDRSNSQPLDGNALQNDIQWGRETVKKFLTKLGLI